MNIVWCYISQLVIWYQLHITFALLRVLSSTGSGKVRASRDVPVHIFTHNKGQ